MEPRRLFRPLTRVARTRCEPQRLAPGLRARGGRASRRTSHGPSQQSFDRLNLAMVLFRHKACGTAESLHSSSAPDPVHIVLGGIGEIVIDHVPNIGDIQTPGRKVGGH